jgi:hypothetical protein
MLRISANNVCFKVEQGIFVPCTNSTKHYEYLVFDGHRLVLQNPLSETLGFACKKFMGDRLTAMLQQNQAEGEVDCDA